jgi:hypothetical protein
MKIIMERWWNDRWAKSELPAFGEEHVPVLIDLWWNDADRGRPEERIPWFILEDTYSSYRRLAAVPLGSKSNQLIRK